MTAKKQIMCILVLKYLVTLVCMLFLHVDVFAQSIFYDSVGRLVLWRQNATNMIYYSYDDTDNLVGVVQIGADEPEYDSNANGISDRWELDQFGIIGISPSNDYDLDGFLDGQEYLSNTDPRDWTSFLGFTTNAVGTSSNGLIVRWMSAAGKYYDLLRSTNLVQMNSFTNIADHIPATPAINVVTDAPAVGDGPYYYRVKLHQ